jgi:hypothetical protein
MVESLKTGTEIIVKLKAGDRLEGSFNGMEDDYINFSDTRGRELKLPKADVRKIETATRIPDRLRNGTLIGLAVGVGAGVIAAAAANSLSGGETKNPLEGLLILTCAGLGTIVGVSVDATIKSHEVIYQAQ